MSGVTESVLPIVLGMLVLSMLLCGWRLARGPTRVDRILALDTLYINTVALLVVGGIATDSALYFEGALVIALLGFVGTVALTKYLLNGEVID
ncbi:MAG TPA: K+/H+ antiporter subunit F [Rhodocyclaceae bacterium]